MSHSPFLSLWFLSGFLKWGLIVAQISQSCHPSPSSCKVLGLKAWAATFSSLISYKSVWLNKFNSEVFWLRLHGCDRTHTCVNTGLCYPVISVFLQRPFILGWNLCESVLERFHVHLHLSSSRLWKWPLTDLSCSTLYQNRWENVILSKPWMPRQRTKQGYLWGLERCVVIG